MHSTRNGVIAMVIATGLAACGPADEANLAKASQCVDLPDGQYFQVVDGRLVAIAAVEDSGSEQPIITAQRIGRSLAGQGFPWLTVAWDGQIATIGGLAPDAASRIDGFRNAKDAFENDPTVGDAVQDVVNAIELRIESAAVEQKLNDAFAAMRISWMAADVKGQVVVLRGEAPDSGSKRDAYRAALNAISIALNNDDTEYVAVDAITFPGEAAPVGQALLNLPAAPSLYECDNALFDTMNGRTIAFVEGESIVENSSKPLMDALAGIAHLCRAYEIEIRQYAPAASAETDVMELSQNRASAIRDQLSVFADRDAIIPRGFGAENPTDPSDTAEALARTQRTEFMVRERSD
jgi:outer membrane protein OmpA-like peptidoglycan-associated protein